MIAAEGDTPGERNFSSITSLQEVQYLLTYLLFENEKQKYGEKRYTANGKKGQKSSGSHGKDVFFSMK